jgi:hypothetical protein
MPKGLASGQTYIGRRPDCVLSAITFDEEVMALLRIYCEPGRRNIGKFLGRLVYEHHAREQERQRLQEPRAAASGGG